MLGAEKRQIETASNRRNQKRANPNSKAKRCRYGEKRETETGDRKDRNERPKSNARKPSQKSQPKANRKQTSDKNRNFAMGSPKTSDYRSPLRRLPSSPRGSTEGSRSGSFGAFGDLTESTHSRHRAPLVNWTDMPWPPVFIKWLSGIPRARTEALRLDTRSGPGRPGGTLTIGRNH
ncbi:hypothetical protein N658DRAFT_64760 [Parathielavia hyrcaniae]|uniref:Uncharacterized protein n=1 Tax=Parathielavia hyrcaniae TaxID=113614 RepID=A0AAN6PQG7_9PEZI|nr:hypothetical protein N658DRAFT_64760 [Parathielavia hyrcaniae]